MPSLYRFSGRITAHFGHLCFVWVGYHTGTVLFPHDSKSLTQRISRTDSVVEHGIWHDMKDNNIKHINLEFRGDMTFVQTLCNTHYHHRWSSLPGRVAGRPGGGLLLYLYTLLTPLGQTPWPQKSSLDQPLLHSSHHQRTD